MSTRLTRPHAGPSFLHHKSRQQCTRERLHQASATTHALVGRAGILIEPPDHCSENDSQWYQKDLDSDIETLSRHFELEHVVSVVAAHPQVSHCLAGV